MPSMTDELMNRWRREAEGLERRKAFGPLADLLRACADELADATRARLDEHLTLHEAAEESGFSYSGMHKMVTRGAVPNVGSRHRPRVRRGDLPRNTSGPALVQSLLGMASTAA